MQDSLILSNHGFWAKRCKMKKVFRAEWPNGERKAEKLIKNICHFTIPMLCHLPCNVEYHQT